MLMKSKDTPSNVVDRLTDELARFIQLLLVLLVEIMLLQVTIDLMEIDIKPLFISLLQSLCRSFCILYFHIYRSNQLCSFITL